MTTETLLIVPARGGSKSIPRKNIRSIAGRPLVIWALEAGIACLEIDRVVLATDDAEIATTARSWIPEEKLTIFWRNPAGASDTAPSEDVILEVLEAMPCQKVVMAQPTSPLLRACDLGAALAHFERTQADSLVSVVRQKRFLWSINTDGSASPVNYDPSARPRRQEFDGHLVENGALYIADAAGFRDRGVRLFGRMVAHEMPEETYAELDEPADWAVIESLLNRRRTCAAPHLSRIKMVLSDIDGVLTDAGMYYTEHGDELKKFNTYDGLGIARLREAGFPVGLITRESRDLNQRRAAKMGVDFIEHGAKDKIAAATPWLTRFDVTWDEVAYIGDDIHDVPLMRKAGLGVAPSTAMPQAKAAATIVCQSSGGAGCLRELAEMILECQQAPLPDSN